MKILVTGAYGQLGNEIKALAGNFPYWKFRFTDADVLDITDENSVSEYFREELPGYIINCAAYTAVDKAETEPKAARMINAVAPGILAKAAKQISAKLIHISTDYVFDGLASFPLTESDAVNPTGVYGKTKLEGEQNCIEKNEKTIVIRTSWLYSAFGNNFVKTMLQLGKNNNLLNVVFDQVGTPTYAGDLAQVILSIIEISEKEPEKFVPGIYHYSNEGVASWFDLAKAVFEISGLNCTANPVLSNEFPRPAKRPNYSVLDKSKIRNTVGVEIPYWRESLKKCIGKMS
jgi:dTDP-4-dehydrorhamnose reductase